MFLFSFQDCRIIFEIFEMTLTVCEFHIILTSHWGGGGGMEGACRGPDGEMSLYHY